MARAVGSVRIDTASCKGCELCIPVCPPRVLEMSAETNALGFRYPVLHDGCTGCELCAEICPDYCFTVFRAVRPAATDAPGGAVA